MQHLLTSFLAGVVIEPSAAKKIWSCTASTDTPSAAQHWSCVIVECGRSRVTITERTIEGDWEALDCHSILVNGSKFEPDDAGAILSGFNDGVVTVVLTGDEVDQTFDLKFSIADLSDLQGVDKQLHDMVRGHQLTVMAIESFLASTEQFSTAREYRAGIANYLYGVLARERSAESGLSYPEYRDRYDQAVALLGGFDRPAADAICGLVAFHYNQFEHAIVRTRSPRVSWASRRLARLVRGEDPLSDEVVPPQRLSLDYVLSDASTEQALSWCCIPLDGSAPASEVDEIESSLPAQEPFDQLKLRIIAAEHYLHAGLAHLGQRHASELRHNPIGETWARAYLARVGVGTN